MKWTLILIFSVISIHSYSAPTETVINYLKSTPAWVDGSIRFDSSAPLYSEGMTSMKLMPNRDIGFAFGENFLELYPSSGVELKVGPLNIKVENIRWDRNGGFTVKSKLPGFMFGLGTDYVNKEIKTPLQKMFGEKMRLASDQLRQIRTAKQLSDTNTVMRKIMKIFTTNSPTLPSSRGEMGLVFAPPQNKVLQLNNLRVGIKAGDRIRAGIGFKIKNDTFQTLSLNVTSNLGIDINEGTEFKNNKRLVFSSLDLSGRGMGIGAHLGASETILGLLVAFEVASVQAGHPPSQACLSCLDLVQLKPVQLIVEQEIREQVLAMIRSQRPQLRAIGVSEATLRAFERRASCQLNGIKCSRECSRKYTSTGQIHACKNKCEDIQADCLN
ncbi:MAG: hypothetical protein K2P81_14190 [Bacteriovoracaceae bacterium]|nr:hypothetical protein [Bacteriovoracaceae bacterium]